MYDWVLIGGGVQSVTIATFLLQVAGVDRARLRIIDPAPTLLNTWIRRADAVGMKTLRSALVHHIDVEPFSLKQFAESREGRAYGRLRGKYGHPDLALFNAHCRMVVEENQLESVHLVDSVTTVTPCTDFSEENTAWKEVVLRNSSLRAKNVVLALGTPASLWPDWAKRLRESGKTVHHCFDSHFDEKTVKGRNIAIIGGGLTAAQLALKYRSQQAGHVTICSRHPLWKAQFDSDPGWIGPKYRARFEKIRCPLIKRRKIAKARHRGSITPEVYRALNRGFRSQDIHLEVGTQQPDEVRERSVGVFERFSCFDIIILATGFESQVPSAPLVTDVSRAFDLALTPCGVPRLENSVHWGAGIYCSGALAEMRIGPIARNIPGARSAAEEIAQAAIQERSALRLNEEEKDGITYRHSRLPGRWQDNLASEAH